MNQRKALVLSCLFALALGCDRTTPVANTNSQTRVVSLSPAATDLLLAMGAEKDLVGVSTFDSDARVAALPRVGDYENVDWERIQTLAPGVMIVQMAPDRLPAGIVERAKKLNIVLHCARIDRFTDIIVESDQIGRLIGRERDADAMWKGLRERIDDTASRLKSQPKVKTLIVTTADGQGVAGPDTFLDDVLSFAGAVNALPPDRSGYSKIDRELLLRLAPEAVVQLMPGATPAQVESANEVWKGLPDLPAVKAGRIYTFTQDWVLMPGSHVAELSEQIAEKLHPGAK